MCCLYTILSALAHQLVKHRSDHLRRPILELLHLRDDLLLLHDGRPLADAPLLRSGLGSLGLDAPHWDLKDGTLTQPAQLSTAGAVDAGEILARTDAAGYLRGEDTSEGCGVHLVAVVVGDDRVGKGQRETALFVVAVVAPKPVLVVTGYLQLVSLLHDGSAGLQDGLT